MRQVLRFSADSLILGHCPYQIKGDLVALNIQLDLDLCGRVMRTANRVVFRMPDRYGHLARTIERRQCRRILEIGVWDALHSIEMIEAALRHHAPRDVAYFGFDLFDLADATMLDREISKAPPSLAHVQSVLQPYVERGVTVHLFRGDTQRLLPELAPSLPRMDFIFIDGGHSEATVRSDWSSASQCLGPESVVLFDDYVDPRSAAVTGVGVNAVVDSIDTERFHVRRLRPVDRFQKAWGTLHIALVEVTVADQRR